MKDDPGICVALNFAGWAAIVLAAIGGAFAINAAFESQATYPVSWTDVIAGLIGGIMLLAVSAIIRRLARIERAITVARVERTVNGGHEHEGHISRAASR